MRYRCLMLLLFVMTLSYVAQGQERNDTLRQEQGLTGKDIEELTAPVSSMDIQLGDMQPDLSVEPALSDRAPVFNWRGIPPDRSAMLPRWSTGYMYGSHSYSGSLMYGYMASASMGVMQNLGDYWTFNGNVSLQKYSVYYNTATFNGSLTWHPNNWFAMTAFGSYMPGSFLSPISLGPSFQWGGYVTLQTDTDVPFGVDMGARDVYDPYTGHTVVPIVQPFVKLGGAKIGIDFGPVIRDAIWKDQDRGRNGFNPIPQPIKAMPQVAPRR